MRSNTNYGLGGGGSAAGAVAPSPNYALGNPAGAGFAGGMPNYYGLGAGGAGGGATKVSGAGRSGANDAGTAAYGAADPYGSGMGSMYSNSMGGDGGYGGYGGYGGGVGAAGPQGGMGSMYGGGSMYGMGGMGGMGGSMMGFDDNIVVSKIFSSRRDLDQVANNSDYGRRYDSYWGSFRSDITGDPSGTSFRRPSMASLLDENHADFDGEPTANTSRSLGAAGDDKAGDAHTTKRPREEAKNDEQPPVQQARNREIVLDQEPQKTVTPANGKNKNAEKYAKERAAAEQAAAELNKKEALQSKEEALQKKEKAAAPDSQGATEAKNRAASPKQAASREITLDDADDIPMLKDDVQTAARAPSVVQKVPSRAIKPDSRPGSRSGVSPTRSVEAREESKADDRRRPSFRAGSRRPSRPHSRALSMDDVTVPVADELKDDMAGTGLREAEETDDQRKRRQVLEEAQKARLEEARKRREAREAEEKKKRDTIAAMDDEKRRQREAEATARQQERDLAKQKYNAQKAEEKEAARVKALMEQREREAAEAVQDTVEQCSVSRPRSRRPRSRGASGLRGAIPEQPPDESADEMVDRLADTLGDDAAQQNTRKLTPSTAVPERPRSRQRHTPSGRASGLRGPIPEQPKEVDAEEMKDTLTDQLGGRASRNSGEDGRQARRTAPTGRRPGSALRGEIPEQPADEKAGDIKDSMEGISSSAKGTTPSTLSAQQQRQAKPQATPPSNTQPQHSAPRTSPGSSSENGTGKSTTTTVNQKAPTPSSTSTAHNSTTRNVTTTTTTVTTTTNAAITPREGPSSQAPADSREAKKSTDEVNTVRTLVLVENIAKSNGALGHEANTVQYSGASCDVTEVKERSEGSFNYQSSVVHDVREAVCAGYNAAVLSNEAPNTASRFDSPVWPILNRIVRSVLQVNTQSDGQLKPSFELSCALGYICDDKVKDLLAEDADSPFEKISVHPSPIYGPRVPQLRYGQITSGNAFEEVLSACLTRAAENSVLSTMDRGVATAFLLLKQIREEKGVKDVYLSSILVSSAGSDVEPYASGLNKAKNDYGAVFHLVLGGPCLTCYMLNAADDDVRKVFGGTSVKTSQELTKLMGFLQQVSTTKNFPLRSGSVKRFIKYVEKANDKARTTLQSEPDEARRKKLERYVKEQERLLTGAYKMLEEAGIGGRNSPEEL